MSHNRRMFGGRPGGPGGPVSPWEGGVVPGQGRPASAGILGAAPQPLNLLSQLSTPEAQLALASNLLTSLLGQQQQQAAAMPQPRVPPGPQPLLSMNATAPGRGFFPRPDNMKGGGPMRQQRGHGNRFPDSYNKQRGDNRMRPNAPMNKRGGGPGGQQRNQRKSGGNVPNKASVAEKKADSEKTTPVKAESEVKKEDPEASKTDVKEEEEDEEAEEGKKRDWKDEKNKKDSSMDVEEEQEEKEDEESGSKGGKGAAKDGSSPAKGGAGKDSDASRYSTIPKELLVCHICNKNMWDGQSFENHLRGKSHQMMMDQTEKTYKVQVKLMRQELKLAEEKREIEMERVQRLGKKVNIKSREYCTMCDLYFFGNIMGHRKNQLHQNLKNFLHPRCLLCSQEFPSRTEWDHHQLTPMHLVKLAESQKNDGKEPREAMVVEDEPAPADGDEKPTDGAEGGVGEGGGSASDGDASAADAKAAGGTGGGAADAKATGAAGGAAGATGAAGAKKPQGRQTVPPYDPKKSYGTHLLKKVLGYTCDVCNRFFFQHKEALAHCQTAPHYKSYAAYLLRTGAAAPSSGPRPGGKQADKAGAAAIAAAPATADKAAADKSADDAAGGSEGKRPRKDAGDGAQGDGEAKAPTGDAPGDVAGDEAGAQEQGADSTTESDDKGEEQPAAASAAPGADEPEDAQPAGGAGSGGGEPATNGVEGEDAPEGQDEGGEEAADEDESAGGGAGADGTAATTPDKSLAAAEEDGMEADEDVAPAPAVSPSKADADKKFGGGQGNRRGMGRGLGRGRGRGHRRR